VDEWRLNLKERTITIDNALLADRFAEYFANIYTSKERIFGVYFDENLKG
jgi:hypothetical protein